MDFKLNEELQATQKMYQDFANKKVRPIATALDQRKYKPAEIYHELADAGFFGIIIPEEYGGVASSYMNFTLAVEEIAKASAPIAKLISGQTNKCFPILKCGTEAQKQKYVVPYVTGEKHAAFVLTEPGAGSDAGAMKTTAVLEGDHFVINGSKTFISGAAEADFYLAFILMQMEDGSKKPICLLIDKGAPGLVVAREEELMGMYSGSVCELFFEDCIVPKENMIGKPGEGFHIAMSTLDPGRLGIAALCVGMAQDAIDQTIKYTKERVQFGKRISQYQNTQFKLAELQTQVNAARLLTYNAAWALDNNEPASHLCSMAKLYASDIVNVAARACLQLHGGYGYTKEYPIERIYRDAKITEIFEGTSEVQKIIISKWMGIR